MNNQPQSSTLVEFGPFGFDKDTAERWDEWWADNQAALKKEDVQKHEAWKKEGK